MGLMALFLVSGGLTIPTRDNIIVNLGGGIAKWLRQRSAKSSSPVRLWVPPPEHWIIQKVLQKII